MLVTRVPHLKERLYRYPGRQRWCDHVISHERRVEGEYQNTPAKVDGDIARVKGPLLADQLFNGYVHASQYYYAHLQYVPLHSHVGIW